VAVLLPFMDRFTRIVERILPERRSPLTRSLDRAALLTPLAAEEAVRRTVARSLGTICGSIGEALTAGRSAVPVAEANDALRQARDFMAEASGPPESEDEQDRLASTLFALDYTSRLAEVLGEEGGWRPGRGEAKGGSDEDARAAELCEKAMSHAVDVARAVDALPDGPDQVVAVEPADGTSTAAVSRQPTRDALLQLGYCAEALRDLRPPHRQVTMSSAAAGLVSVEEAIIRVVTVRRLGAIARNAWQSAVHLVGTAPRAATIDR
jgi:phosphate:Na+ symporter